MIPYLFFVRQLVLPSVTWMNSDRLSTAITVHVLTDHRRNKSSERKNETSSPTDKGWKMGTCRGMVKKGCLVVYFTHFLPLGGAWDCLSPVEWILLSKWDSGETETASFHYGQAFKIMASLFSPVLSKITHIGQLLTCHKWLSLAFCWNTSWV